MPNPSPTPCIAPVATQKRLCVSVVHDTTNGNQRETRDFLSQILRWTVGK